MGKDDKIEHRVKVDACSFLKTGIANAADMAKSERTCTTSTAAFDLGKLENVEVAFALDFTQSMLWRSTIQSCRPGMQNNATDCPVYDDTKAKKLIDAFQYALDTYFSDDESSTAYVSVVPYSGVVNLYPYNQKIVDQEGADNQPNWTNQTRSSPGNNRQDMTSKMTTVKFWDVDGENYNRYTRKEYYFYYTDPNHQLLNSNNGKYYPGISNRFQTADMTYVLNRLPVIRDAEFFDAILDTPNTANLKFDSMLDTVEGLLSASPGEIILRGNAVLNTEIAYARGYCYNSAIVAGADQRIEKIEQDDRKHRIDGAVYSPLYLAHKDDRNRIPGADLPPPGFDIYSPGPPLLSSADVVEFHESYPIQPLTNNKTILRQVIDRLGADYYLYKDNGDYIENTSVDRQGRVNRAEDWSRSVKTQSMNGLLWGWLSINNDWKDKWSAKSITEFFCDDSNAYIIDSNCTGNGSKSRNNRVNSDLPSEENAKHLILITDGFDNDGEEDVGEQGSADPDLVGQPLGYLNACDSYSPAEKFSYAQYVDLCKRIEKDDITIHTILYDFSEKDLGSDVDEIVNSAGVSRYEACTENLYENVTTVDNGTGQTLEDVFDEIFLGILSSLTPVRLTE